MPRPRQTLPDDQQQAILSVLTDSMAGSADATTLEVVDLLYRRGNVVLYGPPGTGKTYRAFQVRRQWERVHGSETVFPVTFHPSYSYEDFVIGFRPDRNNPAEFTLQKGILLEATRRAETLLGEVGGTDEAKKVLLLIDEINRGDVARIFGELITYMEADKRGETFFVSQEPGVRHSIPSNLYFLGTMNTADKSISLLDVALRRRFAFVEMGPNAEAFRDVETWAPDVAGIDLGDLLTALNQRLLAEGVEWDRSIGQAVLSVDADAADPVRGLRERLEYDVYPLIGEYCYLDPGRIKRVLGPLVDDDGRYRKTLDDNEFVAALESLLEPAATPTAEGEVEASTDSGDAENS